MAQKKCFLLGRARSGTTVFRRMLNSHPAITAYTEILNSDAPHNYFQYLALRFKDDPALCAPQHSIPLYLEFLEHLSEKRPDSEVVVFDVKYECMHVVYKAWHAAREIPIPLQLIREHQWHAINVTRRNHLRRYVSNARAMTTGIYHREKDAEEFNTQKVRVEPADLLFKFRAFDEAYDKVAEYFADYENFMEVDYDDLFEEHEGASRFSPSIVESVSNMLGVSNEFDAAPRESKVTTSTMADIIDNYDEVCEILSGTEYESLLN